MSKLVLQGARARKHAIMGCLIETLGNKEVWFSLPYDLTNIDFFWLECKTQPTVATSDCFNQTVYT